MEIRQKAEEVSKELAGLFIEEHGVRDHHKTRPTTEIQRDRKELLSKLTELELTALAMNDRVRIMYTAHEIHSIANS